MAEKQTGSAEKGILARTATYTSKRAKRAQTKIKQRVGKGDATKDEVFDEFVNNFNKQQAAVALLNTELSNYLHCINAMQLASENFSAAVKEVYEPEWSSREPVFELFKQANDNWTKLSRRLSDEVLEPLTSYQKPFVDVKTKIHKRARKLVDYDHSRHTVDTLRAKGATKSSDAKKLTQAEEDYQKAKEIFIELTSELYDELPALYDSRIGFYATSFQSIFTLEEVFHREAARLKHELNDLMDQLITDFSAGTFSTRKPFCAGLETTPNTSEKDEKLSSTGSLTQFYDVAILPEASDVLVEASEPIQPARPAPLPPSTPPKELDGSTSIDLGEVSDPSENNNRPDDLKVADGSPPTEKEEDTVDEPPPPLPNNKPADDTSNEEAVAKTKPDNDVSTQQQQSVIAYRNTLSSDNPNTCNLIVPSSVYQVIATHKYMPEDEDELAFEKGEIIHVIPYDDPEEQDDGWLMGVIDSTGLRGVFPQNFTKTLKKSESQTAL